MLKIEKINIKKLSFFFLFINFIHVISWFFAFDIGDENFYLRGLCVILAIFLLVSKNTNYSSIKNNILAPFIVFAFPFIFTLHVIINGFAIQYIFSEVIAFLVFVYFFRRILLLLAFKLLGSFVAILAFLLFYDYNLLFDSSASLVLFYILAFVLLFMGLILESKFFTSVVSSNNNVMTKDILKLAIFNAKSILAVFSNYLEISAQKEGDDDYAGATKEVFSSVKKSKIFFNLLSKSIGKHALDKAKFENLAIDKILALAIKNLPLEKELKNKINIGAVDNFYFLGDKEAVIYAILNLLYYLVGDSYNDNKNKLFIESKKGQWENTLLIKYFDREVNTFSHYNSFKDFAFSKKRGVYELGLSFFHRIIDEIGGRIESELAKEEYVKISIHLQKIGGDNDGEPQTNHYDIKKNTAETVVQNDSKLTILSYNKGNIDNRLQVLVDKGILLSAIDVVGVVSSMAKVHSQLIYDLIVFSIDDLESEIINTISKIRVFDKKVPIVVLTTCASFLEEDFVSKKIKVDKIIDQSLDDHELIENMMEAIQNPKYINISDLVKNNFPKIKILVVDDQSVIRVLTSKRLKNMGIEAVLANSGNSCLEKLDEQIDINVVMLDLHMPHINGIETSILIRRGKKFKNFVNFKNIPIIIYTGDSKEDISYLMIEHDINDYLAKDFSDFDILRILNKFFCKK